ncbi:MAG: HEAT repeat domain-containing protein [Candidatus Thorarchaeota archaeon]
MSEIQEKVNQSIMILQTSNSQKEKKTALKQLDKMGMNAESALPILMKIINSREDFSVQSLAEQIVVNIGEPAIPYVQKLLNSIIKKKRLKGLGLLTDIALVDRDTADSIVNLIEPIALHALFYSTRLAAVASLKKIISKYKNHQKTIELLGLLLRKERDIFVRHEVSQTIGEADGKTAVKEIVKAMERKSYPFYRLLSIENRVEAANALYLVSAEHPKVIKETLPFLLEILRKDPNPRMRISVLVPLVFSGGWDVIEEILDIIAKDRWGLVRMSALTTADLLTHQKASKSKVNAILPLVKKIAREDREQYVRDAAQDFVEELEEQLNEDEEEYN